MYTGYRCQKESFQENRLANIYVAQHFSFRLRRVKKILSVLTLEKNLPCSGAERRYLSSLVRLDKIW